MKVSVRAAAAAVLAFVSVLLAPVSTTHALQVRQDKSRFDALVVQDETASLDVATTPVSELAPSDALRAGWESFKRLHGADWSIYLDRRSGAPMLVEGKGIRWAVPGEATAESLEPALRAFLAANRAILLADDAELVLDREASARLTPDTWQVVFDHVVAGVPVDGEKYLFTIGYGNLISFGATRWSRIEASPFPDIEPSEALDRLFAHMQLSGAERVSVLGKPALELVARRASLPGAAAPAGPYTGPVGAGYGSALVWTIAVKVAGEPGTWVGRIDAHSGDVLSFVDDNKYAEVKGGVYPLSNDHLCPDGCLQATPLPYADIGGLGVPQTANALGVFNCSPLGGTATTTLAGPYVRVSDNCGSISQSVTCDGDLDLGSNAGTDCATPAGASAGNTNSARTSYYHLNRIAEHARTWLPGRVWLTQQLNDNVNLNQTCNAYWDGSNVNFFKSGGGCANTGELAGVFLHEWGHGLDQNDGGGFDNPSEAYADITSIMSTHVSCLGRGFTSQADVLSVDTGSGDVEFAAVSSPNVKIDTGSGNVRLTLDAKLADLDVDTGSGDVTLNVPATLGGDIYIDTGSGGIDLGGLTVQVTKLEKDHVEGKIGTGTGHYKIETGSGEVRLVRS